MNRHTTIDDTQAATVATDLLVSYPGKHFHRAKREILRILFRLGVENSWVAQTSVWGMAFVRTGIDNREVISRCWALWKSDPLKAFHVPLKWVPVDHWCESNLDAIRELIDSKLKDRIQEHETWALRVQRRRWEAYTTPEIIAYLTEHMTRKVNLTHPDWIIWVDVVGRQTAVSLLRPDDIFSVVQALQAQT